MMMPAPRTYSLVTVDALIRCLGVAAAVASLGSCGKSLQLNLVIYDPCDQTALGVADHIELDIERVGGGDAQSVVWGFGDRGGELGGIAPIDEALVSVLGRESDGNGSPGAPVSAATVGLVDLSGADGRSVVDLNVAIGRVGEFMNTTNTGGDLSCSRLLGERRGHTATRLNNGKVMVVGGLRPIPGQGTVTWWTSIELYSPISGGFEVGPSITWARRGHTATLLDDGRVLIAGGEGPIDDGNPATEPVVQTLVVAEIYDPDLDAVDGTPIRLQDFRAFHTATKLGDGRVLLAGGTYGATVLGTTEIFDPASGVTEAGPNLLQGRAHHVAVRVGASQVALIGGLGDGAAGALASVEFIDVSDGSAGTAIQGPDLAVARSHAVAALVPGIPGLLAVAGGFSAGVSDPEFGNGIASVELIQVDTSLLGMSTRVPCPSITLAVARGAASLAVLQDGLLIAGGVDENNEVLASAEMLRVEDVPTCVASSVLTADALSAPRAAAQMTTLLGDDILVTGGFSRSEGDIVAVGQGEIYVHYRRNQ